MRYLIDQDGTDGRVAALAEAQWGIVSASQLLGVGLTKAGIGRRVRAGRLHRIHRGVYAVGHLALSLEARWMAAVLAAGPGAVLSHLAAAALWGLIPPPNQITIDVTVPSGAGRKRRPGLRIHRSPSLRADEVAVHRDIPVTTSARTLRDLKPVVPAWQFHRAVNQAELDGILSRGDLEVLFPGVADGSRSGLELRFLNICRRHGIKPLPQLNVVVGGRLVDAYFAHANLVVELDSHYHRTETGFHRDRRRGNDVVLAGHRLLRFTDLQLADESRWVAGTVKRALNMPAAGA